jgi:hypothetical protein
VPDDFLDRHQHWRKYVECNQMSLGSDRRFLADQGPTPVRGDRLCRALDAKCMTDPELSFS